MKMTRKEAAHVLECGAWWDHLPDDMSDADMNPLQDALDVALAALRCDWVDAEKQPPTEEGSYLVCTKNGAVTTARYYSPCAIRPAEWQGNRTSPIGCRCQSRLCRCSRRRVRYVSPSSGASAFGSMRTTTS